ncbi:MAG: hypothetical protein ONB46_15890 [candidate division KSB1 bacterium]|nr:hypothetical protein [candidate division KSB1 bacterium]MDZ7366833.1 hypothetical protein [candidate division KSB1 bacterium]MDZ7405160.1 hypothetical protein [candidate division KSB1 bacterium]
MTAEKESDLAALERCKESLKKDGATWVVNPKGQKAFNKSRSCCRQKSRAG